MYNKLFTKILDSSIWLESLETRIVWLTYIAAMDEDGFVQFASEDNVARRANVSKDAASRAIKILESPDKNSSDEDNEGRRIERVPGGWIVLNAEKYHKIVMREHQKAQTRDRVRRFRERRAVGNANKRSGNDFVTPSDTEADTDTETYSRRSRGKALVPLFLATWKNVLKAPPPKRILLWKAVPDDFKAGETDNLANRAFDNYLFKLAKEGAQFFNGPKFASTWRSHLVTP